MTLGECFADRLLAWYDRHRRDLPWRRTTDPYAIWVSEIMLQQTRVAAVIPYYQRFLHRFPNPEALAKASEAELLSAWAGLGYYSRIRNMHRAAAVMPEEFPGNYDAIRQLPGIGDYTAAAIASIAFGLPHAAVDGNVLRVLSRLTNEAGDIGSSKVRSKLQEHADNLLNRARPGEFNQAMMELGATVCLPRDPQCLLCPVAETCKARQLGRQNELPVKLRRTATVRLERSLYIVEQNDSLLLWQRGADSAKLAGFWELPEPEHLNRKPSRPGFIGTFRHSITHHEYTFQVYCWQPRQTLFSPCKNVVNWTFAACNRLGSMALSTTARKAIALKTRTGQRR